MYINVGLQFIHGWVLVLFAWPERKCMQEFSSKMTYGATRLSSDEQYYVFWGILFLLKKEKTKEENVTFSKC